MRYFIICLSLILFLSGLVIAQQQDSVDNGKSLLWEVSGNGLQKSSFLFGTIHMIPKKDFFFTDLMQKAFESSQTLITEADMDLSVGQQISLMPLMMIPDNKSISDYLDKKEFEQLKTFLKDTIKLNSLTISTIQKLKPLFSYSIILEKIIGKYEIYESYLVKKAKKLKMDLAYLETVEEQLAIINKIPVQHQAKILMRTINSNILEDFMQLVEAFKKQDAELLYKLSKQDRDIEKYAESLVENRNKNWIVQLEGLMKKSACFIAVGSGHLGGPDGVIALLKAKGYTLTSIN